VYFSPLFIITLFSVLSVPSSFGQQLLTTYEGFGDYPASSQLESGSNGSSGTPVDGGLGWAGPYDVNNAIKSLVRAENRSSSPVVYSQGEVSIHGGDRAMRLYDLANGGYVWQRPMQATYLAANAESLWFSFLFRSNNGSPLANRDYFQIGFDDNPQASNGTPRAGIGVTTVESTFPPDQPFRFFAKSTTDNTNTAFAESDAASVTTYLLVGCLSASGATYDRVDLFINPSSLSVPGPPSATVEVDSGLAMLSHCFLRTANLDAGDAYVLDELKIGRSFAAVVAPPAFELQFTSGPPFVLHWSALVGPAELQSSDTMESGDWDTIAGPFAVEGTEFVHPVPQEDGARRMYRLRRP
jgi:hypothetical protein